jgi:hypothetical protein
VSLRFAAAKLRDAIYALAASDEPVPQRWVAAETHLRSVPEDDLPETAQDSFAELLANPPASKPAYIEALDLLFVIRDMVEEEELLSEERDEDDAD